MYIEKKKVPVNILLSNNLLLQGFAHLNEGERVQELCNDTRKDYIPVTKVDVYHAKWPELTVVDSDLVAKHEVVLLNKKFVVWIEEAKERKNA